MIHADAFHGIVIDLPNQIFCLLLTEKERAKVLREFSQNIVYSHHQRESCCCSELLSLVSQIFTVAMTADLGRRDLLIPAPGEFLFNIFLLK